jgi:hypothetical protein
MESCKSVLVNGILNVGAAERGHTGVDTTASSDVTPVILHSLPRSPLYSPLVPLFKQVTVFG